MNKIKVTGILGLLTTTAFVIGYVGLIAINPNIFQELNNLSLAVYNLKGMEGQAWASIVTYNLVGLLNIIAVCGLFTISDNKSVHVVGKILFLIAGILWMTFGLINYESTTDLGNHLMLTRLISIIVAASLGLIILGAEFEKINLDAFLKYYTLSSGFLILLLSVLSVFVLNDETWIRTNISLTIYFLWFGVFGIRLLQKASAQQNVSDMAG